MWERMNIRKILRMHLKYVNKNENPGMEVRGEKF